MKIMAFQMTESGMGIKVDVDNVSFIKMAKGDKALQVLPHFLEDKSMQVLFVTENGFGARFKITDIREMGVGGAGVKCASVSAKTGKVIATRGVNESNKKGIDIITNKNLISLDLKEIPLLNRGSQGVKLVNLSKGEKVKSVHVIL